MNRWVASAGLAAVGASLALAIMVGAADAGEVRMKLIGNPLPPSASTLQHARPMNLPAPTAARLKSLGVLNADGSLAAASGKPAQASRVAHSPRLLSAGNPGGGAVQTVPDTLLLPKSPASSGSTAPGVATRMTTQAGTPVPFNYGTNSFQWPFTTSRVELTAKIGNSKLYPYRASGLLVANFGNGWYGLCSASLVARGVIVTAAHCVADFGVDFFQAGFTFYPGFFNGKAPYGNASAVAVYVPSSYIEGTDACSDPGIICHDDVAVIVLNSKRGKYVGAKTGWLGVGYDGFGFNSNSQTQITQLGYPVGIDNGLQMQRTDSFGQMDEADIAQNTLIGTQMNEGSSGGPWVTNFGIPGVRTGVSAGQSPAPDVVVGVTSWGYSDSDLMIAGASPFTADNVVPLLNAACTYTPAACAP